MNKLLLANFTRLKKDKVFWICMICMFVIGIVAIVNNRNDTIHLDSLFFGYTLIIGILASVFCSLFIGTEYSDGTIRNKLMVGHTRSSIYLTNFIVCATASLLMNVSYIISVSALGIPIFGFFSSNIKIVLMFLLCSITITLAFSSIFLCLSMLNPNKAVAAVVNIIGVVAIFMLAIYIGSRLEAPEFFNGYSLTDASGNLATESIPNPTYLRGSERAFYQFLLDFLPTGQSIQIASMTGQHLWQMLLYSSIITIVMVIGGIFGFHKKDLK